ncbi:MAG: IS66 family transposase [Phycisphaerales bacterium]
MILQVDLLRNQVLGLEQTNAHLQRQIGQLRADNQQLKDQLARLARDSSNSSKPPSSDIVKPKNTSRPRGRRKRKIGGQPGHPREERMPFGPDQIDRTIRHELSPVRSRGLIPLDEWAVLQQVELAEKLYTVTEHRARKYVDPRTGRIGIAPLPRDVKAAGLVGPRLSALAAYQKGDCHMSYTTIQRFWGEVLGLAISRSQLVNVVQKVSAAFEEPYEELRDALAAEPYLGVDESGHPQSGQGFWTWCFRASTFTVFHIDPSRGSGVLKAILTETFGGILGSDYYSAYHKYRADCEVLVQFCWAHLIREIRFLAEHTDKSLRTWGEKLLLWVRKLFDRWHRAESLSPTGFARSMDRIRGGFLQAIRRPPARGEAQTLAERFAGREAEDYFRFLTTPGIEPTNNETERAIRHIVIDRHITQGTRGSRGQRWCERVWTVLATCRQQNRGVFEFFCNAINARFRHRPAPSLLH